MTDSRGRFVWYELMTTDLNAAKAFYGQVVGWAANDAGMPDMTYLLLTPAGEQEHVGGMMTLPEEARKAGAPPAWLGYVAVDDVDAAAEQAKSLGGAIHHPPTDIPDVGRFSVIADPQGAAICLFKSAQPDSAPASMTPGHAGWHELMTTDWEKAFDFYSAMFGWEKGDAMDMGEMGTYQIFTRGGEMTGGMMNRPPMVPASYWLYYFIVPDIDAAVETLGAGGGKVLNGPMQVPGGDWIIQGMDPQGAMFALVGKRS